LTHYPLDVVTVLTTNEAQITTSISALIHAIWQPVRDFGVIQHASRIHGRWFVLNDARLLKVEAEGRDNTGVECEQLVLK
jgi:hypothetical protein